MIGENGIQISDISTMKLSSAVFNKIVFNKIDIGGGNHFLIASFCFCASNYGSGHDWTFFDAFFSSSYCYDSSALSDKEVS